MDLNAGWVSVTGSPNKATIIIKGKKFQAPLSYHELSRGKYKLDVKKKGYRSSTIPFTVRAQKVKKINYDLTQLDRSIARKRSMIFPGLGHFYAENPIRGTFWMLLESASLISTINIYLCTKNVRGKRFFKLLFANAKMISIFRAE